MPSEINGSAGSIPAASTTESGDISLKAKGFASGQSDTENAQNCPKLPPLRHDLGTVPPPPTNTGQQVAGNPWVPFVGEYEKQFYEAKHPSGTMAMQHLWPNAGRLHATNGTDLVITAAMGLVFRRCTCGHKYGGCVP